MKIAVIGVGYVGLVAGSCFSDFGHTVYCLDNDKNKIKKLKRGEVTIYEPRLSNFIERNVSAQRLLFDTDINKYLPEVDVIFVAVGTPTNPSDGSADLTNIFEVLDVVKNVLVENQVIVLKSTVPVGTNSRVKEYLRKNLKKIFNVVSNPEFLREGSAIDDFLRPDRVIIGSESEWAKRVMLEVYKPLYLRDFPIIFTDPESAELIKFASNAFLATKISFINEIAFLCEKTGADVKQVAKGMGLDGRIGNKFLHAGAGFGGSCFPKDTKALVSMGVKFNAHQKIVSTVVKTNEYNKNRMAEKILNMFDGQVDKKVFSVLGITFKPNTDDMRDAPSISILSRLQKKGASIRIFDPKGKQSGKKYFKDVKWYEDAYSCAEGADLVVILTEWNEFRALNLKRLSSEMKNAWMADLRNIYSEEEVFSNGFTKYVGVGR